MIRRNSRFKFKAHLNLGPPLRATEINSDGDESAEEGERQVPLFVGRTETPTAPKAKHNDQENKENQDSFTPMTKSSQFPHSSTTKYGKSDSGISALTPSSTFPVSHGSTNGKETRQRREGWTPSSTLPSSFPPLKSDTFHNQDSHLPAQNSVRVATNPPTIPPVCVPEKGDAWAQNGQNGCLRPSTLANQIDPVQSQVTSKPPMDPSANRRREKEQQQKIAHQFLVNPEQPPNPIPEDVVVMRSLHKERRFKRLKLLGCGGSSKVFKVLGEDYQIYALKEVYMRHVDPTIKTAYINEIKLLNKLRDKPEIITLHDYTWDKKEGILYLLLEYAETDFNAVIRSRNNHAHPMATALYFWNEMLRIVKVIHDEGVIHNDLKPENFVVIGARLKLIDFGIANKIEEEKTSVQRDIRCGTINYMAPETIETYENEDFFKVGRPSDIWSLGCILYLMVYGRTPFEHIKNRMKKWQAIANPSTAVQFPDVNNKAALDVMQKCLRRNPKERPTIDELIVHPFTCLQMPS